MSKRTPLHQKIRLTFAEVAHVLSVNERTLRNPRVRKKLPVETDPLTGQKYVPRDRLLRFLVDGGFPPDTWGRLVGRSTAAVLSVGVPVRERVRLRCCRLTPVGGPVSLGRKLAAGPVRAVLLGVEWLPPGFGERWAEEVARLEHRPPVAAVCSWTPPGGLFDAVIHPDSDPALVRTYLHDLPDPLTRHRSA